MATVVFVHHFGGSARTTTRHARLVKSLGFESYAFDLLYHDTGFSREIPRGLGHFGFFWAWREQITRALDAIAGEKIVYSFSMPTNSAIYAVSGRTDIRGLVCDGGPFLQFSRCTWNLFTHAYPIPNRALRVAATAASMAWYGRMPAPVKLAVPTLSFRGLRDPLVPPSAIDDFFKRLSATPETCELPRAGHLDGIKTDAGLYQDRLASFLRGLPLS